MIFFQFWIWITNCIVFFFLSSCFCCIHYNILGVSDFIFSVRTFSLHGFPYFLEFAYQYLTGAQLMEKRTANDTNVIWSYCLRNQADVLSMRHVLEWACHSVLVLPSLSFILSLFIVFDFNDCPVCLSQSVSCTCIYWKVLVRNWSYVCVLKCVIVTIIRSVF